MKKNLIFVFLIILMVLIPLNVFGKDIDYNTTADGSILMDATTGDILYSKNPDEKFPPASTTKIMTMLLTIENCKLDDYAQIPREAVEVDGSRIGLLEGEHVKIIDLLYGLIVESGNDCAITLADHISGSQSKFADLMNVKASELGCKNTHFANPHGLYDKNHYTTARDLALIMKELYKNPLFKEISETPMYKMPPTDLCSNYKYVNSTIKLILPGDPLYYNYATGGKTGWTTESLHAFVSTAEKNNMSLVSTFLHDETKNYFVDAKNLFELGFNNYERKTFFDKNECVYKYKTNNGNVNLYAAYKLTMTLPNNSSPTISYEPLKISLNENIKKGEILAYGKIMDNDKVINVVPLISGENHINMNIVNGKTSVFSSTFFSILIILPFVLLLLITIMVLMHLKKQRTKRKYLKMKYKFLN